jgi:hypothetical protein
MKLAKKSQMEILGLAIVVILILLATVFVVRFVVLKQPTNYRQGFVDSELASNMLSTFLRTTSNECFDISMTDLIRDCSQGSTIFCENGLDSCEYVKETSVDIFSKTFEKWKTKYQFLAYTEGRTPFIESGKQCIGEKRSKITPLAGSVTVKVRLDLC